MLINDVESYLAIRRAAGFDLKIPEFLLRSFARFACRRNEKHVVTRTAIEWASMAPSSGQRDRRLKCIIRFARHIRVEDARHEIPPDGVFGHPNRQRRVPFIFSPAEVSQLVAKASGLGPAGSLRPHTYSTLFALLAATGLRISEALRLCLNDITPDGLVIRKTKFRKSRLVPLHETALAGLQRYLMRRRSAPGNDDHIFVSLRRRGLHNTTVHRVFCNLVRTAKIRRRSEPPVPHVHSLRHTFAVRVLESCPKDRDQIGRHLLALSTYMGHAHVTDTFWYLEATPQLLGDIATAWETFVKGGAL